MRLCQTFTKQFYPQANCFLSVETFAGLVNLWYCIYGGTDDKSGCTSRKMNLKITAPDGNRDFFAANNKEKDVLRDTAQNVFFGRFRSEKAGSETK